MINVNDEFMKIEDLANRFRKLLWHAENCRSKWPDYGREWGPWQEWNGSDRYGPDIEEIEATVNVYRRSPLSNHYLVAEAHHVEWAHTGGPHDVLAYREQKYSTLQTETE